MPEIPRKPYYKPSEVCSLTDTQPYVLRFWESEFPQLAPKKGVYRREDIDLVLRIKEMLNDQDRSIAEVRAALEDGGNGSSAASSKATKKAAAKPKAKAKPAAEAAEAEEPAPNKRTARVVEAKGVLPFTDKPAVSSATDGVPRSRYEDALDEVAHLRLELQESEARRRKAESNARQMEEEIQRIRGKSEGAIAQIEQLIGRLT